MKTIALANQKGGVGKTASCHALGDALAAGGQRVLMVDLDPQGSLTRATGIDDCSGKSLAEVLGGASPGKLAMADIIQELKPNLYIAPADIALAGVELALANRLGRDLILKKLLQPIAGRYDVALVDCHPALGLLTINGLAAANGVIIPSMPQAADLRGVALFLETLAAIREDLNPELQILGLLLTFFDGRLSHHKAAVEAIQAAELDLFPVYIGRTVRIAEAAAAGQSIVTYEPSNAQAANYLKLAEVIKPWLRNKI